jgi:hypothetical protein
MLACPNSKSKGLDIEKRDKIRHECKKKPEDKCRISRISKGFKIKERAGLARRKARSE